MSLFFNRWSYSFSLRTNVLAVLLNEFRTLIFLFNFKNNIMITTFINVFSVLKNFLIRLKSLKGFWKYYMINIWDLFSLISYLTRVIKRFKSSKRTNVNLIRRFWFSIILRKRSLCLYFFSLIWVELRILIIASLILLSLLNIIKRTEIIINSLKKITLKYILVIILLITLAKIKR